MAYQIDKKEDFVEVRVSGETSRLEILRIILELHRSDPTKQIPDLWLVAKESQVPFVQFAGIAQAVLKLLPPRAVGNKTAVVAADAFHEAQIELYRSEASILPFPIRVFRSRDEAVEWIKNPEGPTTPRTVPESARGRADSVR